MAQPKRGRKGKKKERVDPQGIAHIKATFNNTVITLTDLQGNVISWASAGKMGFKGSRKNTPFAAQLAAAGVIETASNLGIPVSTTHCISTSIMGVGATHRLSAVRWGIARNIVAAWIITFPACGILGYIFSWLLGNYFLGV